MNVENLKEFVDMLKSIYLLGGILGAVSVLVVGYSSFTPKRTAPHLLSVPTFSPLPFSSSPAVQYSLTPDSVKPFKPEPTLAPNAASSTALASPALGDKPIPHLAYSA